MILGSSLFQVGYPYKTATGQEKCWMTLLITAVVIGICCLIRKHYRAGRNGVAELQHSRAIQTIKRASLFLAKLVSRIFNIGIPYKFVVKFM